MCQTRAAPAVEDKRSKSEARKQANGPKRPALIPRGESAKSRETNISTNPQTQYSISGQRPRRSRPALHKLPEARRHRSPSYRERTCISLLPSALSANKVGSCPMQTEGNMPKEKSTNQSSQH